MDFDFHTQIRNSEEQKRTPFFIKRINANFVEDDDCM